MGIFVPQVILLEPCYEPYKVVAGLAGATVRYVPLIPVSSKMFYNSVVQNNSPMKFKILNINKIILTSEWAQ